MELRALILLGLLYRQEIMKLFLNRPMDVLLIHRVQILVMVVVHQKRELGSREEVLHFKNEDSLSSVSSEDPITSFNLSSPNKYQVQRSSLRKSH